MDNSRITQIRSFNRAVTRRIGALEESYLSRGRPLGEARLLFEIGPEGAALGALRSKLGLDSGYLSRILRSLEAQGLVSVDKLDGDARSRYATLTDKGRVEHAAYDALSDELANSILEPLSETGRDRLVAAMADVERLLGAASITLDEEPADSAEARQCLARYFDELAQRFEEGFDQGKGNTTTEDEFIPPRGTFVIARLDGIPVGCAALRMMDATTAEIKRMWVSPSARGLGVASRMLRRLEAIARDFGAETVCLDTNRALKEAQSLYRREGYTEIERFNDNPYADHWFSKRL
ncbi:bifunctional helix-turn-helix transcriptional regulator/GNAT family N-acetyltransferase [Pseudaminobacter soli (ex Li et al. 2025)]|uniref:MarR family transcriptional regulator n=1 Tax=Pseudaminobacter soli (ex Li et al. 2025) TaxID=1295366 RepID=A0A2P7S5Z2_9HYPH|nr:helix-turn-helix domain-containing GNAT family N-acetyltransferase [Mesorhizobium soli]PSJ57870.1 MarR family transcriptional regulator [Mesorhizobium soli]